MYKIILLGFVIYFFLVYWPLPKKSKKLKNISSDDPFFVLGVSKEASNEYIRSAFHEQTRLNHPDFVSHMSKDFQILAEQKLKKINWAYQQIKKQRDL